MILSAKHRDIGIRGLSFDVGARHLLTNFSSTQLLQLSGGINYTVIETASMDQKHIV